MVRLLITSYNSFLPKSMLLSCTYHPILTQVLLLMKNKGELLVTCSLYHDDDLILARIFPEIVACGIAYVITRK